MTENIVPEDKPSAIENNCPAVPSKERVESGRIFKLIPLALVPEPVNITLLLGALYLIGEVDVPAQGAKETVPD